MTLGEYIKKYRDEHELSARAFASKCGLSRQYVLNLEKGLNNLGNPISPTMETYAKIAKATGVEEIELLMMLDDLVTVNPKKSDIQEELNYLSSFLTDSEALMLISQVRGILSARQALDDQQ